MSTLSRRAVVLGLPVTLAACGGPEPVWAPQSSVERVRYRHPGPPMLTLFTMKNRSSGNGAHTGLMISGRERVLFDPAGTFAGEGIIERNDVIYGISPTIEQYYVSYHARETYYVRRLEVVVPAETADLAISLVESYGAVAKTQCAISTGEILQQLPGFESIHPVLFPDRLERQFEQIPGVTGSDYYEDDSNDKALAIEDWNRHQAGLAPRTP